MGLPAHSVNVADFVAPTLLFLETVFWPRMMELTAGPYWLTVGLVFNP